MKDGKRIGILTFHDNTNYGSWLQTFGLYRKVKDLGYDVEVIDYQFPFMEYKEKITYQKIKELIPQKGFGIFPFILRNYEMQKYFKLERNKFIKLSRRYDPDTIKDSNRYYDVYLVGSDLVWDARNTDNDFTFMLDFADEDKIRLSYASSCGFEKIPENQVARYKKLLNKFVQITVREKSFSDYLKGLLNVPVSSVSDPTMLLEADVWREMITDNKRRRRYVVIYFNNEELQYITKIYAKKRHLEVISLDEWPHNGVETNYTPRSVSEFLTMLYYAEKIFTSSYHGILFSMYLKKDFAYQNRMPANRMIQLAERLGIQRYEINDKNFMLSRRVDYTELTPRIEAFRRESTKKLEEMLTCCEQPHAVSS